MLGFLMVVLGFRHHFLWDDTVSLRSAGRPLDATFHWGRASISGAYSLGFFSRATRLPIGSLVDKRGARSADELWLSSGRSLHFSACPSEHSLAVLPPLVWGYRVGDGPHVVSSDLHSGCKLVCAETWNSPRHPHVDWRTVLSSVYSTRWNTDCSRWVAHNARRAWTHTTRDCISSACILTPASSGGYGSLSRRRETTSDTYTWAVTRRDTDRSVAQFSFLVADNLLLTWRIWAVPSSPSIKSRS